MTSMKCRHLRAKETAAEMADAYVSVPVDAIICLDGTEIIGAFLARAIANAGINGINRDHSIAVITPEINASNQMLLRDNVQPMVTGKNVILLEASITTGKTINRAIECVQYYGGRTIGISAVFSAVDEVQGVTVHPLFTSEDLPDYQIHNSSDCPMCKAGQKIDALINGYGYSKL